MRRSLQIIIGILSLLPLTFGILGLVAGAGRFLPDGAVTPSLDSQYRFLSAWYLALAFIAWWIIPSIERHSELFRIICCAVFIGGLGRLAAWHFTGEPEFRFLVVLIAELMFPLLIPWQNSVARGCKESVSDAHQ